MNILRMPGQGHGKRKAKPTGYTPPKTFRPDPSKRSHLAAPMITSDIEPYLSPVTGEPIGGRAARKEDLRKHDCYDIGPPEKPLRERAKKREAVSYTDERELNERLDATLANIGGVET